MFRLAMGLRYNGSRYHGFQLQEGLPTIQGRLEKALSLIANHPVVVQCSGRTDAGVHACAQVVHAVVRVEREERAWVFGTNAGLPQDIRVIWAKAVPDYFHARFSAQGRRYRYVIYNQEVRPGILADAVTWYYQTLDVDKMQQAGMYLLGEHDFSAFRGSGCQAKTPVRTVKALEIYQHGQLLVIDIYANAFLMHMVRNVVGCLLEVGVHKREPQWLDEVLRSRDRKQGGVTAPPNGLYLAEVTYPDSYQLPKRPVGPFFVPEHALSFAAGGVS